MKKALLLLSFAVPILCYLLLLPSCSKMDTPPQNKCDTVKTAATASEVADLQAYLASKSIMATADKRGFFYIINKPGSDPHPTVCSTVKVSYTGRLGNGTQFDASGGTSFGLGSLITGWQEGIPLIGKGGSITLYLPPSLAYGSQSRTGIPANSMLLFGIDLLDVQ